MRPIAKELTLRLKNKYIDWQIRELNNRTDTPWLCNSFSMWYRTIRKISCFNNSSLFSFPELLAEIKKVLQSQKRSYTIDIKDNYIDCDAFEYKHCHKSRIKVLERVKRQINK